MAYRIARPKHRNSSAGIPLEAAATRDVSATTQLQPHVDAMSWSNTQMLMEGALARIAKAGKTHEVVNMITRFAASL